MKKITAALALSLVLLLPNTGCQRAITAPTQQTAASPYQRAAGVMLDFSQDLLSAQNLEIQLHAGGVIDTPTHKTVEGYFKQISGYGAQIDALIAAQASSTTIQDRVNSALTSLDSITTATGKLDAADQAKFNVTIQAVKLLLNNVLTQLNVK